MTYPFLSSVFPGRMTSISTTQGQGRVALSRSWPFNPWLVFVSSCSCLAQLPM
jgi:hypothetical protein